MKKQTIYENEFYELFLNEYGSYVRYDKVLKKEWVMCAEYAAQMMRTILTEGEQTVRYVVKFDVASALEKLKKVDDNYCFFITEFDEANKKYGLTSWYESSFENGGDHSCYVEEIIRTECFYGATPEDCFNNAFKHYNI